MHPVPIPDQLYLQARQAAKATGQSLEMFVAEALQLRLNDDLSESQELRLTPDQVASLRIAQDGVKGGAGLTMQQVEENLAASMSEWRRANSR
jgi:hypothetical protein